MEHEGLGSIVDMIHAEHAESSWTEVAKRSREVKTEGMRKGRKEAKREEKLGKEEGKERKGRMERKRRENRK